MDGLANWVGFECDEGTAHGTRARHDVSEAEAEQVFVDPRLLISEALAHRENEPRYHALGQTQAGRLLHVSFTLGPRRTSIRLISARPVNRKERKHYEEEA